MANTHSRSNNPSFKSALIIMSLAALCWLADILWPVSIALLAAYILEYPTRMIVHRGVSRNHAVWLVMMLTIGICYLAIAWLLPLLWRQMVSLSERGPLMFEQGWTFLQHWYAQQHLLPATWPLSLNQRLETEWVAMAQNLLWLSLDSAYSLISLLIYIVLLPLLVFYLLRDRHQLSISLQLAAPTLWPFWQLLSLQMDKQLGGYLKGKAIEALILWLCCFVLFWVFDLPFALLLSVLVGCSVFVPYVGILLVSLPIVLVALSVHGGGDRSMWFFSLYTVLQFVDSYVLVPWLFSKTVQLQPFYILCALLLAGGLFGVWGLLLAIPLASLVKVLLLTSSEVWPNE